MKRLFDFFCASLGLVALFPLFLILALLIVMESKGGVFYKQERVGQYGRPFGLLKFRSMRVGSDKMGLLTVGDRDDRITKMGRFIRKYKLDELPQLINVLNGSMSLVGPRPEVKKYVDLYTQEQLEVLKMKPGITDASSIKYRNESQILSEQPDPEAYYINVLLPDKIRTSLEAKEGTNTLLGSIRMVFMTLFRIVSS